MESEKMKNRYKAAIIGCGNVGCKFNRDYNILYSVTHLDAYKRNPNVSVVALCDKDKDVFATAVLNDIKMAFTDVEQMMPVVKPDIVSICTPDKTHYDIFMEVAKHDCVKAVWCEKPLATTLKDAKEMINVAKEKNIKLMVNHARRYDGFYHYVKKNLKKHIGDVQSVVCYFSGGVVSTGSHLFDLLEYFFGKCRSATPDLLQFSRAQVHLVECDGSHFPIMEMNIIGTKGRFDTVNGPFYDYEYRYFPLVEWNERKVKSLKLLTTYYISDYPFERNMFNKALSDLISCIGRKAKDPVSSGRVALKSLEIISAVSYSKDKGVKVNLPFKKFDYEIPATKGEVKRWKSKKSR
jgi:predicted dehydrogenase